MSETHDAPHPIQPLVKDENGVLRFKRNAIVRYLLDNGKIDLNQIAQLPFSRGDREQFAQLIGYSHSGAESLGYMSEAVLVAAMKMHKRGVTEEQARIAALQGRLDNAAKGVKAAAVALFSVHPDDLEVS